VNPAIVDASPSFARSHDLKIARYTSHSFLIFVNNSVVEWSFRSPTIAMRPP
jgi:hypothetical protein